MPQTRAGKKKVAGSGEAVPDTEDEVVMEKPKPKPKPRMKKVVTTNEEDITKFQEKIEAIARKEEWDAAAYADTTTPGGPFEKKQPKVATYAHKTRNFKTTPRKGAPELLSDSGEEFSQSDIDRSTQKKRGRKGGVDIRNAVQELRQKGLDLGRIEEDPMDIDIPDTVGGPSTHRKGSGQEVEVEDTNGGGGVIELSESTPSEGAENEDEDPMAEEDDPMTSSKEVITLDDEDDMNQNEETENGASTLEDGDADAEDNDAEENDADDNDAEDNDAENEDAEDVGADAENADAENADAENADAEEGDVEEAKDEDGDDAAEGTDAGDADADFGGDNAEDKKTGTGSAKRGDAGSENGGNHEDEGTDGSGEKEGEGGGSDPQSRGAKDAAMDVDSSNSEGEGMEGEILVPGCQQFLTHKGYFS